LKGKERIAPMFSGSEVSDLYKEMCRARRQWEIATEELRQAVQLYQDVRGNSDGVSSVRAASARELETLEIYSAAVLAYAVAVKHSNPS
jgi:hypothetical protein